MSSTPKRSGNRDRKRKDAGEASGKQIPLTLPPELATEFLAHVESHGETQQGLLRLALRRYLREEPPFTLPPDLAIDLQAFCEAHFEATPQRVLSEALGRFLREEIDGESVRFRTRFAAAKKRVENAHEPVIRVIRGGQPEP